jgi:hypothetical protein
MNENKYTKTVDSIHAPESSVNSMLDVVQHYEKKERIIKMTTIRKYVIAASLVAILALGTIIGISALNPKENPFGLYVNAAEMTAGEFTEVCSLQPVGGDFYTADGRVLRKQTFTLDVSVEGKKIKKVTFAGENYTLEEVKADDAASTPKGAYRINIGMMADTADTALPEAARQAVRDLYDHLNTKAGEPVLQGNYDDSAFDANVAMKTIYDAMFNRLKLDVIVTFDNGQTETRTLIFTCNGADPDTGLIVLSAKIQ